MLRHGTPSRHTSDRPNFEHVFSASFKFSGIISSAKSQEEAFLKVFLVGGCGASHGLNVKVIRCGCSMLFYCCEDARKGISQVFTEF